MRLQKLTLVTGLALALAIPTLPSNASHLMATVDGSFVMSSTGSGCVVSPDCWGRQLACSPSEQAGGAEVRDGFTASWRRVPSQMAGKKAVFGYEAGRLADPSWAVVDFLDFLCNAIVTLNVGGTREVQVPAGTKWIAVTGADLYNVRWFLVGPIGAD